ncbi:WecB/TagA/CpsF family glycosyltransferase [Microbacterium marinum]|uniref:WecB/TagA/CpsF family glycosyltransferase n=1 Tax=Microbacterium marinum TaxID=421115 RepID=UPI00384D2AD4
MGDVSFAAAGFDAAAAWIIRAANAGVPVSVHFANAYSVAVAADNEDYARVLGEGVTFADGAPIAWLMSHGRRADRKAHLVRGPSIFRTLVSRAGIPGFLVGSTGRTLSLIEQRVESEGGRLAGKFAPDFGPVDDALVLEIARRVNDSEAKVVWVGMGSPKQDFLCAQLAPLVGRPCLGVGAAFDFYAGTVTEAPRWLQGSGLEWVYRFAKEPRRLARRYTVGNFRFARAVLGRR